jgi:peptidoglycan/xylan/chitin deacetylase (PgdA/CDA1 family)
VAAPVPSPAPQDAVDTSIEATPDSGAPFADLLLPQTEDGVIAALPHDGVDIRRARGPHLSVPILMYHYIRVNPVPGDRLGRSLSVTPRAFAAQMTMLRQAGVTTVSLVEVTAALGGGPPLPPRSVVLTFDDGYADFSTAALPVLIADGFRATVFVVSGFLDQPGYMTTDGVVAAARAGMTIGAHTVHHVSLAHAPAALARLEIAVSRQTLEQISGQPVDDFAYPYGDTSRAVQTMVADAGFHDAVSTVYGASEIPAQQFALERVRIDGADSLATVADKVLRPLGLHRPTATPPAGDRPPSGPAPGQPF